MIGDIFKNIARLAGEFTAEGFKGWSFLDCPLIPQQLRDDLLFVLRKEWLGTPDDLGSPANIMAKLGYNLFLTTWHYLI
jgi:hypothetical protein